MSFKIDSGLLKLDFTDYHAVLGVPVDADVTQIRKRYLKIARRLHPDSNFTESQADKQQASELLSKLVNPAYEKFSKERSHNEYIILLKELSKRLAKESASIQLKNDLSKQLNETTNIDHVYQTSLHKLAQTQYDSFDQVLQIIAQISELNLVYLIRKGDKVFELQLSPQGTETNSGEKKQDTSPLPPPLEQESVLEQYYRRALALMEKSNFAQARVELQDALKIEPNNSRCHSLIGIVYLNQNQNTMAKVHINKALELNPQNSMALKGKQTLNQLSQNVGSRHAVSQTTQGKPSDKSGGSGLFGGLFGKNKK